jgi:hypothetical protein
MVTLKAISSVHQATDILTDLFTHIKKGKESYPCTLKHSIATKSTFSNNEFHNKNRMQ